MRFEISPELIDQIIFAMENQEGEYVLDSESLAIVPIEEVSEVEVDEQFYPLPEWQSVHGYNLMEKFVSSLRNPLYRETLREILSSGRGVFRNFKDALKSRKDIERLWFHFKEKEMRKVVLEWYNQLRESWGLSRVSVEFEDTEELILSDFTIRADAAEHLPLIRKLDKDAFTENLSELPAEYVEMLYARRRSGAIPDMDESSLIVVAETPVGEFAGFVWGQKVALDDGLSVFRILQLYVRPEYRGLGLSKVLLHKYTRLAYERRADMVDIEVLKGGWIMLEALKSAGFEPFSQVLSLDMVKWERDQHL